MARKNMDILVGNILGDATIQPQEKNDKTNVTSKEKQNKRHQGCYVKMCTCSHVYMNTLIHIHIDTCTHVA